MNSVDVISSKLCIKTWVHHMRSVVFHCELAFSDTVRIQNSIFHVQRQQTNIDMGCTACSCLESKK